MNSENNALVTEDHLSWNYSMVLVYTKAVQIVGEPVTPKVHFHEFSKFFIQIFYYY